MHTHSSSVDLMLCTDLMFDNINWNYLEVLVGIMLDQPFMPMMNQHWRKNIGPTEIVLISAVSIFTIRIFPKLLDMFCGSVSNLFFL